MADNTHQSIIEVLLKLGGTDQVKAAQAALASYLAGVQAVGPATQATAQATEALTAAQAKNAQGQFTASGSTIARIAQANAAADAARNQASATTVLTAAMAKGAAGEYDLAVTTGLLGRNVAEATAQEYAMAHADEELTAKQMQLAAAVRAVGAAFGAAGVQRRRLDDDGGGGSGGPKWTEKYRSNLTALSFAVNDFASNSGNLVAKLNGVSNNIPGILDKIGPAGLGLALGALIPLLGMVGGALATLVSHWGVGVDTMKTKIDSLKEKIKAIEEQPIKSLVDLHALEDAHRQVKAIETAIAAVEKLTKSQTTPETESGHAVGSALTEAGGAEVAAVLRNQIVAEELGKTDYAAQKQKESAKSVEAKGYRDEADSLGIMDVHRKAAAITLAEEAEAKARELAAVATATMQSVVGPFGSATQKLGGIMQQAESGQGEGQIKAQAELARRLEMAGKRDLAFEVRENSPDKIKADREFNEGNERATEQGKGHREKVTNASARLARETDLDLIRGNMVAGLDANKSRDDVAADAKAQLRAIVDKAGTMAENLRYDVVSGVVKGMINGISAKDVSTFRDTNRAANQATKDGADGSKEAKAKADRQALETGLGDPFIAQAQAAGLDVETNPRFQGKRDAARGDYQAQLKVRARQRLMEQGMDPGRAAELADGAGDFMQSDTQRQLSGMQAGGDRRNLGDRMQGLQEGLGGGGWVNPDAIRNPLAKAGQRVTRAKGTLRKRRGEEGGPGGMKSVPPVDPATARTLGATAANQGAIGQTLSAQSATMTRVEALERQADQLARAATEQNARAHSGRRGGGR